MPAATPSGSQKAVTVSDARRASRTTSRKPRSRTAPRTRSATSRCRAWTWDSPSSSIILSAAEAARLHPRAQVLSQDTGFDRDYGANPYVGYDDPASQPFLLDEKADPRLPPKERVLAVRRGRDGVVLPLSVVRKRRVIAFDAFDTPVVALYAAGVTSALDRGRIDQSADVGSAVLFDARVADRRVKLRPTDESGRFAEDDGTIWDLAGRALSGPGKGQRLRPVAGDEQFWFAYAAFLTGTVRIVR